MTKDLVFYGTSAAEVSPAHSVPVRYAKIPAGAREGDYQAIHVFINEEVCIDLGADALQQSY